LNEEFLHAKLDDRREKNAFRSLRLPDGRTDFCSNDYLGITHNGLIEKALSGSSGTSGISRPPQLSGEGAPSGPQDSVDPTSCAGRDSNSHTRHGSTGSRLLAGNYPLIEETERSIAAFHAAEAGLIFNSGYDANLGLLSSVPQRGDTVLFDYLSHASIRDGIRLSFAQSFSFFHNDLGDLEKKLKAAKGNSSGPAPTIPGPTETRPVEQGHESSGSMPGPAEHEHGSAKAARGNIFVVTESVFSMDGDMAPLAAIAGLCERYGGQPIVDEAHATGVVGNKGEGLVQSLGLQDSCFARIHTFGKAVGCHGAIVLGSMALRDYLINFSRAFIYTTALPETSIVAVRTAYALFPGMEKERQQLQQLIGRFQQASLRYQRLPSLTPIQVVIVPGNAEVKELAQKVQAAGLDVRPILYPTVQKGGERLRIVLHAFNSVEETDGLIALLR